MAKKKNSIDTAIKDNIKDAVKNSIEGLMGEDIEEENENELDAEIKRKNKKIEIEVEDQLKRMLGSFPSSDGFYAKIYKRLPNGKFEYKYCLEDFDTIQDPENEIFYLIGKYHWGAGDYKISMHKQDHRGIFKQITLPFSTPDDLIEINNNNNGNNSNNSNVVDNLKNVKEVITVANEITGKNNRDNNNNNNNKVPPIDPNKVYETISDSFKAGVDAVPKPKEDNTISALVPLFSSLVEKISNKNNDKKSDVEPFIPIITKIIEKSNEEKTTQKDTTTEILMPLLSTVIEKLSQQNSVQQEDSTDKILKQMQIYKELFAPKEEIVEKPKSILDDMNQLQQLVGIITTLSQTMGGGNNNISLGAELIRSLTPTVPDIISNVTGAVNNYVDYKKTVASNIPNTPTVPINKPLNKFPKQSIVKQQQSVVNQSKSEENIEMLPIFKVIKNAIETNNKNFYPQLKQILIDYDQNLIKGLMTGIIKIKDVLKEVSRYGGKTFLSQESTVYFNDFVNWLKTNEQENKITKTKIEDNIDNSNVNNNKNNKEEIILDQNTLTGNEIIAVCQKCKEEYIYESIDEYKAEVNPICDICAEKLIIESDKIGSGTIMTKKGDI